MDEYCKNRTMNEIRGTFHRAVTCPRIVGFSLHNQFLNPVGEWNNPEGIGTSGFFSGLN